ncbi:PREDICTED: eukaryotic translation initiation factor 5B partial, partial [Prunus dulcis]
PAPRQSDVEAAASRAVGKRPVTVDLEASPASKRSRPSEASRAVLAVEDEDGPAEAVTIACPSKTVQFVNHMILGSQMELPKIDELPKKLRREQAGRAFRLQASVRISFFFRPSFPFCA